jgi:integrase
MSSFAKFLADRVESYIALRRSLGYAFTKSAAILRALARYVADEDLDGPFTQDLAVSFVLSWDGTANGRAIRHGVVRRFCDYLAIHDGRTEALDPRTFPRSRAIPPPHILTDEELGSLMSACRHVSPRYPERSAMLTVFVGLLASTGLRSGEARTSARPSSVKSVWFRSTRRRWPPYADTPAIAIPYFQCQGILHSF